VFVFLILALLGLADWILHLWTIAAAVSLVLNAIAAIRLSVANGDVVTREPPS